MAIIVFITGGCRSGKSAFAQQVAENVQALRVYLATAPALDEEMALRIAKHQAARSETGWQTVEETLDIAGALGTIEDGKTVLVDCLTLWINNLMYEAEMQCTDITDDSITSLCSEVIDACKKRTGTVIFVTNEVGMGIVPHNSVSRLFRDLAGRCNQLMATAADTAVFMVSGLPVYLKGTRLPID